VDATTDKSVPWSGAEKWAEGAGAGGGAQKEFTQEKRWLSGQKVTGMIGRRGGENDQERKRKARVVYPLKKEIEEASEAGGGDYIHYSGAIK